MRKIKFIDRPEVLGPCVDCGAVEVCAKCKSDIADTKYWSIYGPDGNLDMWAKPKAKGKNWYGEDGLL